MKTRNIAFAGFRHAHIYALYDLSLKREDLCVVGAWEEHEETSAQMKEHGIDVTYASYSELLSDPKVDIVAIGNYYRARGPMVIAALKAGKHVLSDKPFCSTMEEAEQIAVLQRENNLAVGMMLDLRTNSNFHTAKMAIDDGLIGKVNNISFNGQHSLLYGSRPDWYFEKDKYCGVISDIAIHGIDLVRLYTHSDVDTVVGARCWNFYADKEPDFMDSAQFVLKMKSGAGVIGDVSYAEPVSFAYKMNSYWDFKIWGSDGVLEFSFLSDGVTLYKNGETKPRKLDMLESDKDYLDEFLDALTDTSIRKKYNREMLSSMKQTILVQNRSQLN